MDEKLRQEIIEALKLADFAIEATEVCLNSWNGGRGSPANTELARKRISSLLKRLDAEE